MKGHHTDAVSLVFGVIFLAIAAWWPISHLFTIGFATVGWIVAVALILLGVLGLAGALRGNQRNAPPD
jgi:hypothetical protein